MPGRRETHQGVATSGGTAYIGFVVIRAKARGASLDELAARLCATLEAQLPPGRCEPVLADALRRADLTAVPEDAEAMVFFATGPLHEAVEADLGEGNAAAVLAALGPVLDEVWIRERRRVAAELSGAEASSLDDGLNRRASGVRRQIGLDDALPTDIEQLEAPDTTPAATGEAAEAAAAELALKFSAAPPVAISEIPPSSNRLTVPYLPNARLTEDQTPAVVVADLDDDNRHLLGDWLHVLGCVVARAANREQLRSLVRKLRPQVVIADEETLTGGLVPLGPALTDVMPGLTRPAVILLTDEALVELPEQVHAVLQHPVMQDDLLAEVTPLVDEPADGL